MQERNDQEKIDLSSALNRSVAGESEKLKTGALFSQGNSRTVRFLIFISGGLIKSKREANFILISLIALIFFSILFLISFKNYDEKNNFMPPAEAPLDEVRP